MQTRNNENMLNTSNLLDELLSDFENIKLQSTKTQQPSKIEEQKLDVLKLQKNIIEKELEIALNNFDIKKASKLSKDLDEIELVLNKAEKKPETKIQQTFEDERQKREMTYQAFLKLKDLPKGQTNQILKDSSKLKEVLGDWFDALCLWLEK